MERIIKIIVVLIAFLISMIIFQNTTVNATNTIVINVYEEIRTEYDILKNRQKLSNSNENIEKFKKVVEEIADFKNNIYKLKELSVEELQRRNYNGVQIKAIKTYDGSEEKSLLAAATMKLNVSNTSLSYNKNKNLSTVKATVNFTWGGGQEEYGNDSFARRLKLTMQIILRKSPQ